MKALLSIKVFVSCEYYNYQKYQFDNLNYILVQLPSKSVKTESHSKIHVSQPRWREMVQGTNLLGRCHKHTPIHMQHRQSFHSWLEFLMWMVVAACGSMDKMWSPRSCQGTRWYTWYGAFCSMLNFIRNQRGYLSLSCILGREEQDGSINSLFVCIFPQGQWSAFSMVSFSSTTQCAWACTNAPIPSGPNIGFRFFMLDLELAGTESFP